MKIIIPQETIIAIKDKYIALDTCVLLDLISFSKAEDR